MFRPLTRPQLAFDLVLAAGFVLLLVLPELTPYWFGTVGFGPAQPVVGLVFAAAVAARRWSPALALGLAWLAAIGQMVALLTPRPSNLGALIVLYAVAAYGSRRMSRLALASAVGGAAIATAYLSIFQGVWGLAAATNRFSFPLERVVIVGFVFALILFALLLSWTAGALVRSIRVSRETREAQRRAEAEAAAEQERVRIARDMHDIVGHSLAVVIAQADGARYAAASDPEATTEALATIASTARAALTDVRLLLEQLRHSQGAGPQPGLADLDALFAQVHGAGVDLRVEVRPPLADPPAPLQLAVYRIVQEALTNALRHGDGGAVSVRVAWSEEAVSVEVRNGVRPGGEPSAPAPGHGIIGMTERAHLVGGSLGAAPRGDEFVVVAVLPRGLA
ncbi:MAG: two-component sensor histidine kinase [Microbacterium sp.]|uniref:histidine kinase n=1 Tax=Microbacterium ginsengisoli TaxID=400772 RepID=A0A0F0LU03_9MICO|nr:histidine kinase [Microbacterium ginsengisoli]KJL36742.1 Sensor histidine kinase DesK [Microbacterium ginsengisoli]MAL05977.1 two-component sensor histidine kinase [Microbacterium sp.]MBN9207411.1 two-component sensor histidine kinase [Microbacterium ginsengisoli]HAN23677.1 two-component sensor histidine kinase [Microbacterium ginsengisoli]